MNGGQIETVWRLLAQTWGAKFLEQYGPRPNEAWSAAMANVSPEAAKHALMKLIDSGTPFPPTLPEFIAHAKKYRPVEIRFDANGRAYLGDEPVDLRSLPSPVDPETARANIQRLRDTLKGVG